jgi:hypothetical protein
VLLSLYESSFVILVTFTEAFFEIKNMFREYARATSLLVYDAALNVTELLDLFITHGTNG